MVAPVVRDMLAAKYEQRHIFGELFELDREGIIELRPESGSGLLSDADKEACPKAQMGQHIAVLSSAVWK